MGGMVPSSRLRHPRWETGSPRLERYNGYSAVEIVGEAALESVPDGDGCHGVVGASATGRFWPEWTAMSYRERTSGAQARAVRYFAISRLPVSGGIVAKALVGALR